MSTDGSILDANNSPVLNLESTDSSSLAVPYSGPEKHDVISLSNCSSTEMEFKLKQGLYSCMIVVTAFFMLQYMVYFSM